VETGTQITTDCWRGYNKLSEFSYTHERINHSIEFVSHENSEIHTNTIERVWRDMRADISPGLTNEHLENHIKEYMVIKSFNARNSISRYSLLINPLIPIVT